jgi:hypothetical protein
MSEALVLMLFFARKQSIRIEEAGCESNFDLGQEADDRKQTTGSRRQSIQKCAYSILRQLLSPGGRRTVLRAVPG